MLIHTGTVRVKVVEIPPFGAEWQAKTRGLLSSDRLLILLANGTRREITFNSTEELKGAVAAVDKLWSFGIMNLVEYYYEHPEEAAAYDWLPQKYKDMM